MTFTSTQIGAAAVFRLRGVCGAGADFCALHAVVASLPRDLVRVVYLDLARTTRLDGIGIGELVRLRHRVVANGLSFGLVNLAPRDQKLLDLARLSALLGVRTLEDQAETRISGGIGLSLHQFAAAAGRPGVSRRARLALV